MRRCVVQGIRAKIGTSPLNPADVAQLGVVHVGPCQMCLHREASCLAATRFSYRRYIRWGISLAGGLGTHCGLPVDMLRVALAALSSFFSLDQATSPAHQTTCLLACLHVLSHRAAAAAAASLLELLLLLILFFSSSSSFLQLVPHSDLYAPVSQTLKTESPKLQSQGMDLACFLGLVSSLCSDCYLHRHLAARCCKPRLTD